MTRLILQGTAQRWRQLNTEIHVLDTHLKQLVERCVPVLLTHLGVSSEVVLPFLIATMATIPSASAINAPLLPSAPLRRLIYPQDDSSIA
jgi:hypothetical protein